MDLAFIFFKVLSRVVSHLGIARVEGSIETHEATIWDAFRKPVDISSNGHYIDWLFNYITWWNLFYFILVCIGLFGFSYFYSAKRNKVPEYTHGYRKKQLLVTFVIGLAVFLTVDVMVASISSKDLKEHFWSFPTENEDVVKVEILAQQWMWAFRYAGADNVFNTDDDIVSNHNLYVPVNKKVEFRLTSKDVIHSFYLPNARNKVDAMPGRVSRLWFEPIMTGSYDIACAEMCGTHHYLMQAKLHVVTQEEFLAWTTDAAKVASYSVDPTNKNNYWGWPWGTY